MSKFTLTTIATAILGIIAMGFVPSPWKILLLIIIVILYAIAIGIGSAFIQLNFFQKAFNRGNPNAPKIALTFDDGPDPETTECVLDILAANNIPATFFCIGDHVQEHPEIAKRITDEGHTIANHTMHHRWYTNFLFGEKLESEIEQAQKAIHDATDQTPTLFRPPMGLTNPHFKKVLKNLDLKLIGWDLRPFDLNTDDPQKVLQRLVTKLRPGSIILLHDAGQTREFLSEILTGFIQHAQDNDLNFVTIDDLQES